MNVIAQVASLFLLMLCGWVSDRCKIIPREGVAGMNKLVVYFSLPCLTVAKLQQSVEPGIAGALAAVFFLSGAVMLLCGLVGWLLYRKEEAARRAVLVSMCIFPNASYMGFPVLTAAFGAENLIYGVLYVAMFNLLSWSVGVALFDRSALRLRKILQVPSLIASVLGIALFALGIRLPRLLVDTMDSMGSVTTPLAMFIIGARLSGLRPGDLRDGKLLGTCALRLLVFPLATLMALRLLGVGGMVLPVVTLCTAMPGAAMIAIQAETYGGDGALASRGVAASTLLSIITIPLILLLL